MADEFIPELTLNPNSPLGGQAQAAPPKGADTPQQPASAPQDGVPDTDLDEAKLTPAQRKAVEAFAKTIDITDSNVVLQYGAAAQKNVSEFSENTLQQIRTKDLGEIGDTLSDLVRQLQDFDPGEEKKGLSGFFRRKKNQLATLKASYAKASANVDKIVENLEAHQITLMKDVANLDQMFELNAKYQQELTMYILAGKKRLAQIQAEDLAQLQQQAQASGTQADAQAYNDMVSLCNRFEKKLHDLELTRMISLQMGPQTRMLQNNDTLMIEKIQSSLVNTIPLWKSQMVLALGLEHARQATAAQNAVTEMTNNLLRQNADLLKSGTIETAREAERSIVDLETLRHTNQQLMDSLDEVLRIQTEGAQKRREAEAELGRIEGELKQKLLALRT
ncbi:MAG: toxic anion resistance protein [Evtepia sp.]